MHCKTAIITKFSDEVNLVFFYIERTLPPEWQKKEMATDTKFLYSALLPSFCIYRNSVLLLIRGFALLKYVFRTCIFFKWLTCFLSKRKYKTRLAETSSSKQILTLCLICSSIFFLQRICPQAKLLKVSFESTYVRMIAENH